MDLKMAAKFLGLSVLAANFLLLASGQIFATNVIVYICVFAVFEFTEKMAL